MVVCAGAGERGSEGGGGGKGDELHDGRRETEDKRQSDRGGEEEAWGRLKKGEA